jgi:hypothetical protein
VLYCSIILLFIPIRFDSNQIKSNQPDAKSVLAKMERKRVGAAAAERKAAEAAQALLDAPHFLEMEPSKAASRSMMRATIEVSE